MYAASTTLGKICEAILVLTYTRSSIIRDPQTTRDGRLIVRIGYREGGDQNVFANWREGGVHKTRAPGIQPWV